MYNRNNWKTQNLFLFLAAKFLIYLKNIFFMVTKLLYDKIMSYNIMSYKQILNFFGLSHAHSWLFIEFIIWRLYFYIFFLLCNFWTVLKFTFSHHFINFVTCVFYCPCPILLFIKLIIISILYKCLFNMKIVQLWKDTISYTT